MYHSFSIRLFELTFALKRKLFSHLTQTVYTHFLSFDQVMSLTTVGFQCRDNAESNPQGHAL